MNMTSLSSDLLNFRGKTVLITGAATGIGRAVALAFAQHGARVSIGDLNEDLARETLDSIERLGAEAIFVRTDVSREAEVQQLVSETVRRFGQLDCAFNNAGIAPKDADRSALAELDVSVFDRLLAVNLRGIFLCMRYELQEMTRAGKGAASSA
jgi:NAD(P)-dependent dehydrogenase (short-subunit alcohol dehydrogenase family)